MRAGGESRSGPLIGALLGIVAAGVLAYGVRDLQEARFVGGLRSKAFDVTGAVPPDSWYGTLLKGVFNFQPDPTVVQVTVWALCLIPTMIFFLAPRREEGRAREGGPPRRRRRRRSRVVGGSPPTTSAQDSSQPCERASSITDVRTRLI